MSKRDIEIRDVRAELRHYRQGLEMRWQTKSAQHRPSWAPSDARLTFVFTPDHNGPPPRPLDALRPLVEVANAARPLIRAARPLLISLGDINNGREG